MMSTGYLKAVAAWPLWLARQPQAVREKVIRALVWSDVDPGAVLVRACGADTGLVGVIAGQVALELHERGGGRRLVDLRTSGFWGGRATPIRPTPERLAVVVHRPATVVTLPPERVTALIAEDPGCLVCFADLMSAHAQVLAQHFDVVAGRDPTVRLARKIIACAGAAAGARLEATQLELAEMTNASRNTVNRVLTGLERDGALRLGYAYVVVNDAAALRQAAGLDPEAAPEMVAAAADVPSVPSLATAEIERALRAAG
jgi:CRP-like cAMP-binding protein